MRRPRLGLASALLVRWVRTRYDPPELARIELQPGFLGPDNGNSLSSGSSVDANSRSGQRKARRMSRGRLCLAVLIVFCLRLASVELLIPDVHDGDASVVASTGSAAERISILTTGASQPPVSGPLHTHHVDHCTHGHADGVPATIEFSLRSVELIDVPPFLDSPSFSLEASPLYQPPKA